ncbi:VOC family protein [Chengkuizengella sediminis]|uniref:VOC family protein n=1 Tax=Chengkuizengella sediminis TaxID=1885917 RepID=UPI001389BFA3|nr:VOC family protein [Chengkuizengella sediminis]NDI35440.1 bleomycin resistance family protein [Chengkuizengella sediminis]
MKLKKFTSNFIIEDLRTSIEYYRDLLGFNLEMVVDDNQITTKELDGDKKYVFAIMSKDDLQIMFQTPDSIAEDVPAFKEVPKGISACFYLEVEGLTNFYQEVREKVEIVKDLYTTWYGMQEFHIKDCNGNFLGFAEKAE